MVSAAVLNSMFALVVVRSIVVVADELSNS